MVRRHGDHQTGRQEHIRSYIHPAIPQPGDIKGLAVRTPDPVGFLLLLVIFKKSLDPDDKIIKQILNTNIFSINLYNQKEER